jgi:Tfp pilus assembly protein PilZ
MKPWISILAFALLAACLIWVTLRESSGFSCSVCVSFNGSVNCANARAPIEEEALQGAIMSACSTIAHGVTETLACQRTEPEGIECTQ